MKHMSLSLPLSRHNTLHRLGFAWAALFTALMLFWALPAGAHCDGIDGPVVTDAKQALEEGDVTGVLKWIPESDEEEVIAAFDQAMQVRGYGDDARELADTYFFETLVRLHRAHEGAAFTGLKPSGTTISPAIIHADNALASDEIDELAEAIAEAVEARIREKFAATSAARAQQDDSVEAGRDYVFHYVDFVHFVKHIHEVVTHNMHFSHATSDDAHADGDAHAHE